LKELRQNPAVRSVFSFGDTLHVIFNEELKIKNEEIKNNNFQLKEIEPTIEDCFMAFR